MTKQTKAHTLLARYRVNLPAKYLDMLESTNDPVSIRGTPYRRFTWRGVPGRLCDVIVAESIMGHRADDEIVLDVTEHQPHQLPPAIIDLVLEIGDKIGKYDDAKRRRYALRYFSASQREAIPWADIRIYAGDDGSGHDELMIAVRPRDGGTPIVDTFARLRSDMDGYDIERVVRWHAARYYRHLDTDAEVIPAARAWAAEVKATGQAASWTLAEANRSASRYLYRLSRELGWRKLTSDEKTRLFLPQDSPQWQRQTDLAPRYAALAGHDATGCGQATLDAAHTGHWAEEEPLGAEVEEA